MQDAENDNKLRLMITLTNNSDVDVSLQNFSLYIARDGRIVYAVPDAFSSLGQCTNNTYTILPGETKVCTFTLNTQSLDIDTICNSDIILYINSSAITRKVDCLIIN